MEEPMAPFHKPQPSTPGVTLSRRLVQPGLTIAAGTLALLASAFGAIYSGDIGHAFPFWWRTGPFSLPAFGFWSSGISAIVIGWLAQKNASGEQETSRRLSDIEQHIIALASSGLAAGSTARSKSDMVNQQLGSIIAWLLKLTSSFGSGKTRHRGQRQEVGRMCVAAVARTLTRLGDRPEGDYIVRLLRFVPTPRSDGHSEGQGRGAHIGDVQEPALVGTLVTDPNLSVELTEQFGDAPPLSSFDAGVALPIQVPLRGEEDAAEIHWAVRVFLWGQVCTISDARHSEGYRGPRVGYEGKGIRPVVSAFILPIRLTESETPAGVLSIEADAPTTWDTSSLMKLYPMLSTAMGVLQLTLGLEAPSI
jgi:hypothetical protein